MLYDNQPKENLPKDTQTKKLGVGEFWAAINGAIATNTEPCLKTAPIECPLSFWLFVFERFDVWQTNGSNR